MLTVNAGAWDARSCPSYVTSARAGTCTLGMKVYECICNRAPAGTVGDRTDEPKDDKVAHNPNRVSSSSESNLAS